MKKFSNALAYVLVFALMLGCCPDIRVHAAEHDNVKLENANLMVNDYIGLYASRTGRFAIGTTGGNPENELDNEKKLLFGYSNGSTSYTTFCIDGEPYRFYGDNAVFSTDTASNASEHTENGIHMYQQLSFCKNGATGREDIVEIKYIVTNVSDTDKSVGCRIMMDTQVGNNDRCPFRVPGYGAITTEKEFVGEDVPQIWQAFNNISKPGTIAQGRLYKRQEDKPDKIQFANWERIRYEAWDYQLIDNNNLGDSSVAITWNEEIFAPGESREYVTYFGLSELTQDLTGPMLLSVYSESELEIIENAYAPNPFSVNAYIENAGTDTMENIRVRLELPEGLTLWADSTETIEIGSIKSGVLVQETWNVKAEDTTEDQYYKLKIVLEYGDGESKTVTRTVHVPAIAKKTLPKALGYTLFSGNSEQPLAMYGWQSYITGNVYSGNDYIYQGSILNVTGKVDAVGKITTGGWQLHMDESNEEQEAIEMPDLRDDIVAKADIGEIYSESKTFTEDTTVFDGTICSEKDITFAGTNFSGSGYVIANANITCNINQGSTYNDGKVVMYAKEGDITLNGSEIALNGILYAPNGTVSVNANVFRLSGRIIAKNIVMNTSQNYIEGDESDISYIYDGDYETEEPERRGFYERTFLEDEITENLSEDGTFRAVCDAGVEASAWNHVTWNGIRTDDSNIEVTIATSEDGETYSDEVVVTNGTALEAVYGRYAKVTVYPKPSTTGDLPRITDLTVSTEHADLMTNAAPAWNLGQTVYETEKGNPVTVSLHSQDDAIGTASVYKLQLNDEDGSQTDAVLIEDISAIEKKITIEQSGTYNFTATVSDGELSTSQIISIYIPQENPEEENPEPEEPEYTLISQIEKIDFNEDFSKLQIVGTASAQGHLKKYHLSYGLAGEDMVTICEGEQEIENGLLGEIATENLESGNYVMYLVVEDETGVMCQATAEFELTAGQIIPGGDTGEDNPEPEEPEGGLLTEEQRNQLSAAKQSAIEWLKAQADEEGNWSKDGLMNTTCDALAVLQVTDSAMESTAYHNWVASLTQANVDEQCHAIWGKPDEEAMKALWSQQNADGGFGLTATFTSDLYDTLLVLKTEIYMQELGYASVEEDRLSNALNYIASRRNADGGFGYHEQDGSRITLTAEYAIILHKLGVTLQDESLKNFCEEQYTASFEEESYYHQTMLARVQHQYNGNTWTAENLEQILSVQKENGSIYEDVENTILFITLMDEMMTGEE